MILHRGSKRGLYRLVQCVQRRHIDRFEIPNAMNEHHMFLFGERTMRIMASCPTTCEQVGLPLCPAVVFFSALNELDDASQVVPCDLRNQALGLTAERLRASDADFKLQLAKMTELLEAQVNAGDFDFVTPVALLKASAAFDSGALEAAFDAVGLSLDTILSRIERDLPSDKLVDKPPSVPRPEWPPRFAVVIEGPGFRDTRNRYPTLVKAEFAAEFLEASLKCVALTHTTPYPSVFVSRPPEFEKTTRIYVERIPNAG